MKTILKNHRRKVTVYLGRRDFVDNSSTTEPIDGVVSITYRFGREEDEVMGINFSKEMQLVCREIPLKRDVKVTEMQERLLTKLGASAYPFSIDIPDNAPCSVQLFSDHSVKQ
ncbi:Phosrestin-1 [Portunus trituberculatus]|uniref:Phosrestin-1 n=1 Tax=Portunus trituberculatus TaxID=210409 RepID=A0A5B7J727_PORTR|nr:Phosrestin-1 [Portunus trituberculatus]